MPSGSLVCIGVLSMLASGAWAQAPAQTQAIDEILTAWRQHRIVAVSEVHRVAQPMEFFLELIRNPGFANVVNDVAIEFGNALHQSVLDRYIDGEPVAPAELRRVWADTTVVNGLWEAPMYERFLTGIRERNRRLPKPGKVRVLACDPPIDWSRVQAIGDAAPHLRRDSFCAALLEREVYNKGRRALVIMGDAHVARRHMTGRALHNVVTMIEEKHPGSVFTVLTWHGELKDKASIEQKLSEAQAPSVTRTHGTWLGALLALPLKAPTRTRVGGGQAVAEAVTPDNPPTLDQVTDALLYLGPSATLTRSAPTADHFSAEELRELERRHRIVFGLPLDRNALFH